MNLNVRARLAACLWTERPGAWCRAWKMLLFPASLCYGAAVRIRVLAFQKGLLRSSRLPCKVVSVGNLSLGGTGKTPTTIYMAELLQTIGCRVAVACRGYGGTCEKQGALVSDGQTLFLGPGEAGDEPYLLARKLAGVPVAVGRDRARAGRMCVERFGSEVLVLDDGFQHLGLRRDLDLVLLDSRRRLCSGRLFPGGFLREPASHLSRADAVLWTRSTPGGSGAGEELPCRLVFHSSHEPVALMVGKQGVWRARQLGKGATCDPEWLQGRRVLAFSGIADNDDFFRTLEGLGGRTLARLAFPDHHRYLASDVARIADAARDAGVEGLVTTEKDWVRLPAGWRVPLPLFALQIRIVVHEKERFEAFVRGALFGP